jgi:hypothetical protein
METSSLGGLLSPPILFFFLGMIAVWLKSGLRLPEQISKFLSLYLLIAIGFHGGVELSKSGMDVEVAGVMLITVLAAILVPIWSFFILRLRLDTENSAAIAATYGSISAVTFITAVGVLQSLDIPFNGHMIAAMALMESPAIIVGVILARSFRNQESGQDGGESSKAPWSEVVREAFASGPIVLLLGSLVIGLTTGTEGWGLMEPVFGAPFKAVLVLFLLDMGINAALQLKKFPESSFFLTSFAILAALVHAGMGIGLGWMMDLGKGDALLLAVLCGSASYIAVPAAAKLALPQANPGLYVPMSLGITFPFNVIVGIPVYLMAINFLWAA